MDEEYTLQEESDDILLNNIDLLKLSCDLAGTNISAARGVLNRFFSLFFPKHADTTGYRFRACPSLPNNG
jgi:hypothetical protein